MAGQLFLDLSLAALLPGQVFPGADGTVSVGLQAVLHQRQPLPVLLEGSLLGSDLRCQGFQLLRPGLGLPPQGFSLGIQPLGLLGTFVQLPAGGVQGG